MWKDHIFRKALGPMLQQIDVEYEASEGEVFPPRTLHDLLFNFSLNCLSLLQQQDGPELEHDELSFSYLPVACVVLFCMNAPPCRRSYWTASLVVQNWLSNGNEFPMPLPPNSSQGKERHYQEGPERGCTIFCGPRGFKH
jgi:hypothetical protein